MLPAFDARRRLPSEVDLTLLWSGLVLLLLGMVMVYSASIAIAEAGKHTGNHPAYFLIRHGVFLSIGLIAAGLAFQVPLQTWQKVSPWLFVAGFVLLALVLIPGIGHLSNGARGWFVVAGLSLRSSPAPPASRRGANTWGSGKRTRSRPTSRPWPSCAPPSAG